MTQLELLNDTSEMSVTQFVRQDDVFIPDGLGSYQVCHNYKINYVYVAGRKWPVGMVSDTWRLVQMDDLCTLAEGVLKDRFPDAQVRDVVGAGGSYVAREYRLPLHGALPATQHMKVGTTLAMLLRLSTGYDGQHTTRIGVGTEDLLCTNGMVGYKGLAAFNKRHTKNGADLDVIRDTIHAGYDQWDKQMVALRDWSRKYLDIRAARQFVHGLPRGQAFRENMQRRVEKEIQDRGPNVYSLFSALTYYASHDDEGYFRSSRGDQALQTTQRQEEVEKWINGTTFKQLLAA